MSGHDYVLQIGGNGVIVPGSAAQWTIDPATTGLSWFGWGALAQIQAEEYSPSLPRVAVPSWAADAAQRFLDEGFTWIGVGVAPGICRSDGDWFGAWLADGCPISGQSRTDYIEHAYWPIEGSYYWTSLDWYMEFVKVLVAAGAARGITVNTYIKFADYNSGTGPAGSYKMSQYPARYGDLMLAIWQRCDVVHGVIPVGLDVINEPGSAAGWGGPSSYRDAMLDAKGKLNAAGYDPTFFCPSTVAPENLSQTVFNTLYNANGGSLRSRWQPSSHLYAASVSDPATADTQFAATAAIIAPQGRGFINTEYPATPLRMIWAIVYGDLTGSMNYTTVYDGNTDRTKSFYLTKGPDTLSDLDHTLGNRLFYRYIRPGMVRIGATKANSIKSDLRELVAFKNSITGKIACVAVLQQSGRVYVNLRPGTYKVYYQLGSESIPMTGQNGSSGSVYSAGASDFVGRAYTIVTGQGIELTADTAGAAGTYAAVEQ